jgi:hypothetical protein
MVREVLSYDDFSRRKEDGNVERCFEGGVAVNQRFIYHIICGKMGSKTCLYSFGLKHSQRYVLI